MAERKLRFWVNIDGKEEVVVSATTRQIDVPAMFRTRGRVCEERSMFFRFAHRECRVADRT
jgi:hypothetical protein